MRYNPPYGVVDPDAPFINGDPSQGRKGSIIPAESVEFPQRELVGLSTTAGFQPTNDDLKQLTRSVRQGVNYILATYAPSAVNDLKVILDPPLDTYRPGLVLRVKIPVANTGSATLEVNGLGAKQFRRANGAVLSPGDLVAGMVACVVYDGTAFQMINFMGLGGTGDINNFVTNIPYCDDVGTTNHILAPFSPAITSLTPGLLILVKTAQANTSPVVDIKVNSLATAPVTRTDLRGLAPNDFITGTIVCLVFDGTRFQMISMPANMPRILTAPMAYYVNPATGSDSNNGLTAATPFATIQKAFNEMATWTNTGFTFSIYLADFVGGFYAPATALPINGSGDCRVIGNDNNPERVVIYNTATSTNNNALILNAGYHVTGVKLQSNNGAGIVHSAPGTAVINNIDFGPCGSNHIQMWGGAALVFYGAPPFVNPFIRISGSAGIAHLNMTGNCLIFNESDVNPPLDYIIANSVSLPQFAFVQANSTCALTYRSLTNGGFVTGAKFNLSGNSVIDVQGRGINFYPGTSPGYVEPGSVYR